MCVSKGAPRKPSYGPCNERHGMGVGLGSTGATYLYNGTGTGYYWPGTANSASSTNGSTTTFTTVTGWTTT